MKKPIEPKNKQNISGTNLFIKDNTQELNVPSSLISWEIIL